jgi:hypothetical protein
MRGKEERNLKHAKLSSLRSFPFSSVTTQKKKTKVVLYRHYRILTFLLCDSEASALVHFDLILYVEPRGSFHYVS